MKKYFALFSIAAAIAAVSCTREQLAPETPEAPVGKTVINVTAEMTKTTMGELSEGVRPVYWANGDKIAVNGILSDALEGLEPNSRTASFTFTNPSLVPPFRAVYPETIWRDNSNIYLPAAYYQNGIMPLSGYGVSADIAVNPLTAAIKLSIKLAATGPDTDMIKRIDIDSDEAQLSGRFAIDFETGALTSDDPFSTEVSFIKNFNLSDEAVEIFIPVPAGTYNFTVKIKDIHGHYMEIPTTSAKTFVAGEIKAMPVIEFVPTGTELDVEINSAEELIAFAEDWNDKSWDTVVAQLGSDIVFDINSSAAFNATGGIGLKTGINGDEDFYFNGIFDGNGKTISGLQATVPLFVAIGEDGTVKDLTIDTSCSFEFTHPNTGEAMFGSVVGYHKGLLDNVKSAADINLAAVENVAKLTTLGGLVGRATVGKLENCEYSGLISTPAGFTTTNKLIVGGLVGRFSNAGSVKSSNFKGAISNESKIVNAEGGSPYYIVGGVVGYVDGEATVSSCTSTADHNSVPSAYSGWNGIIVNKTVKAYNSISGGIVGELYNGTVSNCTNSANIANSVFKDGGAGSTGNASARYMKTGGIAGRVDAAGVISECTNNGAVEHRSNPRLQDIAGIAGYNAGKIRSCTNTAKVSHMTTGITGTTNKGGRIVNMGGIVGENVAGAAVSDVHNTGAIQISAMESNYDSDNNKPVCEARMGGVIAYNLAAIDGGASKNITNSGQVYFNCNFDKQFIGYELGGIVGYSTASVLNAKNTGYVYLYWNSDANVASKIYMGGVVGVMAGDGDISGCVNEGGSGNVGEVYMNIKNAELPHTDNHVGGILAYTTNDVNIADCNCSGFIHTSNYTAADKTLHVGGIVGSLAGKSSISSCNYTGQVFLNATNNTDNDATKIFAEGGIVGFVQGTAEDRITISSCNWTYTSVAVGARRGTCGGVAGYAEYADISSSDVRVDYNMYNHITGGVVGWAVNSNISGCKFYGTKIAATQGYASGGIVAKLDAGSIIDGCYNYCKDITATKAQTVIGEIAATSVSGTTIKNCHHTGTINICSDTNFTDGGGNVIDP